MSGAPSSMEGRLSFIYAEETPNMKELECHVCLEPIVDPVVHTECQVMFCRECISPLSVCPTCGKALDSTKLGPVPKFIISLLESLKVKCPTCNASFERRSLNDHIPKCPVLCELGCGFKIAPIDKLDHEKNSCNNVSIHCPAKDKFCTWTGLRGNLAEHSKACQFAQMAPVIQVLVEQFQELLKQQHNKFTELIKAQQIEIAQLHEDMITNMNVSAMKKKWKLTMSSKFFAVANTYESLIDDDYCLTGAATENTGKQWIQATFDFPVLVSSLTISGFKGAMLAWRADYCEGKIIQYSHDDITWRDALTIKSVNQGKPTKITLEAPVIAKYWRLYGNGYCATASLIFE